MEKILLKSLAIILIIVALIILVMIIDWELNQYKNAKKLILNGTNSINEQKYVEVGGIKQWITIRGEDRANPILLVVPGGPGSTYTVFNPLLRSWEKHFTIVQWDMRGSGKTFRENGKKGSGSITLDILKQDGIELSEYLCEYLNQEKLILIGSSVGSIIGTKMVKQSPELFYAYVATDHNVGADPKHVSYNLTLKALEESGNKKDMQKVRNIGPNKSLWSKEDFHKMNKIMVGSMPGVPNMVFDLNIPSMKYSPDHSIRDIFDIFNGMNFSLDMLYDEIIAFNAYELGLEFKVPFFTFNGDNDIITPSLLAEEYLNEVVTPHKEFALIKDAGHLAAFTRPEQFLDELIQRVKPFVK